MKLLLSLEILCCLALSSTDSFTLPNLSSRSNIRNHRKGSFSLVLPSLSSDDDESSFISSEEERMEYVRELQKTFYASTSNDNKNEEDEYENGDTTNMIMNEQTGVIQNLPLWRVGWVELPGRANCLNVIETQYTHMFETILNSKEKGPFYVGHLHLPGGFQAALQEKNTQLEIGKRFELKTYEEELLDDMRLVRDRERSAVVGTLMRISDYRRRKDGRLTLLVHPVERFVVTDVVQQFPYSVANVRLLPDFENNDKSYETAVRQTFQFMSYEHDENIKLPLPGDDPYVDSDIELKLNDFSKILPFAHYSKDDSTIQQDSKEQDEDNNANVVSNASSALEKQGVLSFPPFMADLSKLLPFELPFSSNKDETNEEEQQEQEEDDNSMNVSFPSPEILEKQLEVGSIVSMPPFIAGPESENRRSLDSSTLERMIWTELDEFCSMAQFTLPQEILRLMPPSCTELKMDPPNDFLSYKYPIGRRRRRLSYSAPAILESMMKSDQMTYRQMWLNIPSTQNRLALVLERFELVNGILRNNQPLEQRQQQEREEEEEEDEEEEMSEFE